MPIANKDSKFLSIYFGCKKYISIFATAIKKQLGLIR